jgi:hypothetical protein
VREGKVIWAEWVSFASGATVKVALPHPVPCSREELGHVVLKEGGVLVASGVHCADWVAAVPVPRGTHPTVLVATCHREQCGALLEWSVGGAGAPPVAVDHPTHWPSWATWTLVGAGVVGATAATLVAAGVFRSSAPVTNFQEGGLVVH